MHIMDPNESIFFLLNINIRSDNLSNNFDWICLRRAIKKKVV